VERRCVWSAMRSKVRNPSPGTAPSSFAPRSQCSGPVTRRGFELLVALPALLPELLPPNVAPHLARPRSAARQLRRGGSSTRTQRVRAPGPTADERPATPPAPELDGTSSEQRPAGSSAPLGSVELCNATGGSPLPCIRFTTAPRRDGQPRTRRVVQRAVQTPESCCHRIRW
jgi:hypothetical protein